MDSRAAAQSVPRFWMSLVLLCWGMLTDSLSGALVMALLFEAIGLVKLRWRMENREFHRAADLSALLLAALALLQFSRYSVHGVYQTLTVLPYCFFPILIAQRASTVQSIPLSALFYGLRRHPEFTQRMDFTPFYVAVCLIASTTTAQRGPFFLVCSAIIIVGILAIGRPKRYSAFAWVASLILALGLALVAQYGFLRTHRMVEAAFMYWLNQYIGQRTDPERAITSIGAIGRLKLSDQIRLRIEPDTRLPVPLLLQEASYDTFQYGTWKATNSEFDALSPVSGAKRWLTTRGRSDANTGAQIIIQHREDLVVLPVPRGTREISSEEIAEMQINGYGTLMAESPPGALSYHAEFDLVNSYEPPPGPDDLLIPPAYETLLAKVGDEIGLDALEHDTATARIRDHFAKNFSYSLVRPSGLRIRTPLAEFLLHKRYGHCEYFATATVLLLRQAGIPARYAVGYLVEEYSRLEGAYIARARDAHSWALAYLDGQWRVVDTTPSVWHEMESEQASNWQTLGDLFAWITYRFQRFQQADLSESANFLVWLVPPLAILLYFRLRRSSLAVKQTDHDSPQDRIGGDASPMGPLLSALAGRHLHPEPGETLSNFFKRIDLDTRAGIEVSDLLTRYYQFRYSTKSLNQEQTRALRQQVQRYTEALES